MILGQLSIGESQTTSAALLMVFIAMRGQINAVRTADSVWKSCYLMHTDNSTDKTCKREDFCIIPKVNSELMEKLVVTIIDTDLSHSLGLC